MPACGWGAARKGHDLGPHGPDVRYAVVGSKSYFANRAEPRKPQDLVAHELHQLPLPTSGGLYAWEFEESAAR